MYETILIVVSLFLSLAILGFLRTSLWLLPSLFLSGSLPIFAASWLSFFSLCFLLAPFQDRAFVFSHWKKDRWALVFFLTGVSVGALLYPQSWPIFALGSLIPFFFMRLFDAFRLPCSRFYFLPSWFRFAPVAVTIGLMLLHLWRTL